MDVTLKSRAHDKKIKFFLVFFYSFLMAIGCKQTTSTDTISLHYDGGKPVSVQFFVEDAHADYTVSLEGKTTEILGEQVKNRSYILFTPVIPFTKGASYQVLKDGDIFLDFTVDAGRPVESPRVLSIHPEVDTVPENLLKMYVSFSKPMQQSKNTLEFITVTNLTEDTSENIFLSLENELWNRERTQLTLWLDPGRIKKDLIPNKKLGIPIQQDHIYEIKINKDLMDGEGNPIGEEYIKKIVVSKRDTQKPLIDKWKVTIPKYNTEEALDIHFNEPLDVLMIEESIRIVNKNDQSVDGNFEIDKQGKYVLFTPNEKWEGGTYKIIVYSILEDLAGNNLNRLFDRDLSKKEAKDTMANNKIIPFTVK